MVLESGSVFDNRWVMLISVVAAVVTCDNRLVVDISQVHLPVASLVSLSLSLLVVVVWQK
mgnify:CR=1 FL=1